MNKYFFHIALFVARFNPGVHEFWHAFITAMLSGMQDLYEAFFFLAKAKREEAALNSQTITLEYTLNKIFNGGGIGIYIENVYFNRASGQEYIYWLFEEVERPYRRFIAEGLPDQYIVWLDELFSRGSTFIVHIPEALEGIVDEDYLNAVVAKYALADKTWTLNYY